MVANLTEPCKTQTRKYSFGKSNSKKKSSLYLIHIESLAQDYIEVLIQDYQEQAEVRNWGS